MRLAKPVPRTEASAAARPVVREGGLRVVVAANSFARLFRRGRRGTQMLMGITHR